ncbi:hypothetical protein SLA2020_041300 [Shorea laevis]
MGCATSSFTICVLVFLVTKDLAFFWTLSTNCVLNIKNSTFKNKFNNGIYKWGGFINEKSYCGGAFDEYLCALGRQANLTRGIYLNLNEEENCMTLMRNVSGCGIERLTNGPSGCSNYTVSDVVNKLGDGFGKFQNDCKNLSSSSKQDQSYSARLRRWEEIGRSTEVENDVYSFAVLVPVISNRIDDENWIHDLFKCPEENSF